MNFTYDGPKYYCTKDTLKDTIEKYGVAVIPNVLNNQEIDAMKKGTWDTLKHITSKWNKPIDINVSNSWKGIKNLFPLHSMLIQHWSIGHAQYVWDLRQNPKIIDIFANFWNTNQNDLLVSFDGVSIHMPPESTKIGYCHDTGENDFKGLHTDQSYTRNDFECMQSWVTAYDVNEGDATLCILEGSHKFHADFAKEFNVNNKDDWYLLKSCDELTFYTEKNKCIRRHIKCPAGSMVFWDSRTIHKGVESLKTRKTRNFRSVVYICMQPRNATSQNDLDKKIKIFEDMRMTSHWTSKIKLFPKNPRTYGADVEEMVPLPKPILSNLGKRLVGYQ